MQQHHLLLDILNLNNKTSDTTATIEENDIVFAIADNVTMDTHGCVLTASNSTTFSTNTKSPHKIARNEAQGGCHYGSVLPLNGNALFSMFCIQVPLQTTCCIFTGRI